MLMTPQLTKQLHQIKLPMEINSEGTIYIKKGCTPPQLTFEKGHYYVIHLDEGDVSKQMLEVTSINWNQGRKILSPYLKCEYIKSMGNMVCLNASGYDPNTETDLGDIYFNIWVDSSIIKILQEIM